MKLLTFGLMCIAGIQDVLPSDNSSVNAWGQARLDRVLQVAGKAGGSLKFRLSDSRSLNPSEASEDISFPKHLLLSARSIDEIDGLLVVLTSEKLAEHKRNTSDHSSLAAALAYGALIAATGGASDQSEGKGSKVIPLGTERAARSAGNSGTFKAFRAAAWNERLGHCQTPLVSILKRAARAGSVAIAGEDVSWPGDPYAKTILRDLGMLASPTGARCSETEVEGLSEIQGKAADALRTHVQPLAAPSPPPL